MENMVNVDIVDNGSAFCITVNGVITSAYNCLGDAWRHIKWMYLVAQQKFTVSKKNVPVIEWIDNMTRAGYLEPEDGYRYV